MTKGYNERKTNQRKETRTFLIVCEGEKTERTYFNNYRERKSGLIIFTPNSAVTDPGNLVDFAISQMQKYEIDFKNGDQVWCVFDADENSNEIIKNAQKKADDAKINLCFSNPCFELWYLLHFNYFNQKMSTQELKTKLKSQIQDYDKTKDYFDILLSKRKEAIKNSQKLKDKHTTAKIQLLARESNPSTQVVDIVQQMLKIIEENKKP